jgi:hypothetical protein
LLLQSESIQVSWLWLEENISRVKRRRASRPGVPLRPKTNIFWNPVHWFAMHASNSRWRIGPAGRGPGRRTILWSAIDHDQQELTEEETAESDKLAELVRLVRTF